MAKHRLEIDELGAKGDGIATDGTFVPFALPGEIVEVDSEAESNLPKIVRASHHRVDPVCQHFGTCGGCALQHLGYGEYLKWKQHSVVDAFAGAGIDCEVVPCLPVPGNSRRRATFSAITTISGTILGFLARQSHELVDMQECPVLVPEISQKIDDLRDLAGISVAASEIIKLNVLACDNGLDISIEAETALSERRRKAIIDWAVSGQKVRVTFNGETIIQTITPQLTIGEAVLVPPPGGFVQAVREAEQQMIDLVTTHLKKSKRVVDLFSGAGTFALQLVPKSTVHAVEYDQSALSALTHAHKNLTRVKSLTSEARDLDRRPLQSVELDKFDGAVFDPPRAGAEAQTRELARSKITRIAAVSCNPTTLARDARILLDAGYKLIKVTPIDQFLYSTHVEVVALFERKKVRAKRPIFG